MKSKWTKLVWVLLVVGLLSPIVAMFIKPAHYFFYMFFPATPDTVIGRLRLIAGDVILVVGFVVALSSAIGLVVLEQRLRRGIAILSLLLVAANPLQQPIWLESLDTHMNYRWRDRAEQLKIVGKTPDEISTLFGKPSYVWTETPKTIDSAGKVTWQGETYTGWDYHVLPFYWIGSKFQVFFVDGKVRNFEANDD